MLELRFELPEEVDKAAVLDILRAAACGTTKIYYSTDNATSVQFIPNDHNESANVEIYSGSNRHKVVIRIDADTDIDAVIACAMHFNPPVYEKKFERRNYSESSETRPEADC